MIETNKIYNKDCILWIKDVPDNTIDLVIIEPPYKIRKKTYEVNGLAIAVKKYILELQRDN